MFIDEAKICVKAGEGGNGCISFHRAKFIPKGGPDGGDGGDGGSIILKVDQRLHSLYDFKYKRHYKAKKGSHGQGKGKTGRKGADLIIKVPQGTLVYDQNTKELLVDLKEANSSFIIAQGGKGGKGNVHFATSTNRSPRYATSGKKGEQRYLWLELKL